MAQCLRCGRFGFLIHVNKRGVCEKCQDTEIEKNRPLVAAYIIDRCKKLVIGVPLELKGEDNFIDLYGKKLFIIAQEFFAFTSMEVLYYLINNDMKYFASVLSNDAYVKYTTFELYDYFYRREPNIEEFLKTAGSMAHRMLDLDEMIIHKVDLFEEVSLELCNIVLGDRLNPVNKKIYDILKKDSDFNNLIFAALMKKWTK